MHSSPEGQRQSSSKYQAHYSPVLSPVPQHHTPSLPIHCFADLHKRLRFIQMWKVHHWHRDIQKRAQWPPALAGMELKQPLAGNDGTDMAGMLAERFEKDRVGRLFVRRYPARQDSPVPVEELPPGGYEVAVTV